MGTLIFIVIFTCIVIMHIGKPNSILNNKYTNVVILVFLFIFFITRIPFNDLYKFDLVVYYNNILKIQYSGIKDAINISDWEPIFSVIQYYISKLTNDFDIYLIIMSTLYLIILIIALNSIFTINNIVLPFFLFINFSFFYAYIFNGVRQGITLSLIILIIGLILKKEKIPIFRVLVVSILSFFIHSTSIAIIATILFVKKTNINNKKLIMFWLFASIIYITDINKILLKIPYLSNLSIMKEYSSQDVLLFYGSQNSIMFWIFSAFFLVCFLFSVFLCEKNKFMDGQILERYKFLIKIYISINSLFLIFGFIAFSNRIAIYSWYLIPLIFGFLFVNIKPRNQLFVLFGIFIALIIGVLTGALNFFFV
ncbi:EpsG family protein [Lysinibacillus xylanilyticus]|uniref:EpsG family protein n=1 Tax=Lysinibacillus xylanilyticus TaxID=582475 RepID=UPI002B24EE53|nr:EpsG family protein [Lysinibacillus xylanilyticus]MEB2298032.1 EpsG family protein [Lysinibacillus xylanilyticus]